MRKSGYMIEVSKFETEGFVKSSKNTTVLYKLRNQYGEYLRIFNAGSNTSVGGTGAKYGSYDLFGDKICYYYDIRKESKFIDFLIRIFYEKNPNPDGDIRKSFTRILHTHKLHWFGCRHEGKDRPDVDVAKIAKNDL